MSIVSEVEQGLAEIEPTEEAQEAWFQVLLSRLGPQAMFFAQCIKCRPFWRHWQLANQFFAFRSNGAVIAFILGLFRQ